MPLRSSDVNLGQYFIRRNLLPVRELANQREREVRITQQPFWQLGDLCPHLPPWCSIIFPHPTFSPVSPPPTRHTFSHFPPSSHRLSPWPLSWVECKRQQQVCVWRESQRWGRKSRLGLMSPHLWELVSRKQLSCFDGKLTNFVVFRKQNSPHLLWFLIRVSIPIGRWLLCGFSPVESRSGLPHGTGRSQWRRRRRRILSQQDCQDSKFYRRWLQL